MGCGASSYPGRGCVPANVPLRGHPFVEMQLSRSWLKRCMFGHANRSGEDPCHVVVVGDPQGGCVLTDSITDRSHWPDGERIAITLAPPTSLRRHGHILE